MKTPYICLAVALFMSMTMVNCSVLSAGFYLSGAQIYKADINGVANDSYRYTTNSQDIDAGSYRLGIEAVSPAATRQDRAISFQLLTGVTNFEFDTTQNATLGSSYVGLNLFFSETNTSFNPPVGTGSPIAGHITAVAKVDITTGVFTIVDSTRPVQSYAFGTGNALPTGSASFALGDNFVTLTSFSVSAGPNGDLPRGSFGLTTTKLQITATPEPATLGLGGLACISLFGFARKAWRRGRSA